MDNNEFKNESIEVLEKEMDFKSATLSEKITYFFTKPSLLFKTKIDKPSYGINFLILCIITVIYNIVNSIILKPQIEELMNESLSGLDAQSAGVATSISKFATSPILSGITSALGFVISVFFLSLIYWALTKLFKGEGSYSNMVSTFLLASYASATGMLVKIVYMLITKNAIGSSSLKTPSLISTLTAKYDIFQVWYYVLLVIGISVVFKISKKKSFAVVLIIFLIGLSLTLGGFAITAASNAMR